MVLATILILLFTTVVLLTANWSLLKQKQLLHTNIDFFNNMAHEFRTPLANMSLAVNMLSKKHQQLQTEPLVDILRKENTRLLTEVERVLHIASLDDGDFGLQKEKLPSGHAPQRRGRRLPGQDRAAPRRAAPRPGVLRVRAAMRIEGDLQQMPADFPVPELWQVLAGRIQGRSGAAQVTIFDSVGFALEDYSALRYMRELALEFGVGGPLALIPALDDPKDLFGFIAAEASIAAASGAATRAAC